MPLPQRYHRALGICLGKYEASLEWQVPGKSLIWKKVKAKVVAWAGRQKDRNP